MKPIAALCKHWKGLLGAVVVLCLISGAALYFFGSPPPDHQTSARKTPQQLVEDLRGVPAWHHRWMLRKQSKPGWFGFRLPVLGSAFRRWAISADQADFWASMRRQGAREALMARGTNAWPVIPSLIQYWQGPDQGLRLTANDILWAIQADQHPAMQNLARSNQDLTKPLEACRWRLSYRERWDSRDLRWETPILVSMLRWFDCIGTNALPLIPGIAGLVEEKLDPAVRAEAIKLLGKLGAPAKPALRTIMRVMGNADDELAVRGAAVVALARLAPEDPEVAELVGHATEDQFTLVRVKAAQARWLLKTPAEQVLPVLAAGLEHKNFTVRVAAIESLADMGAAASPAVPKLKELLSDGKEPVRHAADTALSRVQPTVTETRK